jgi:hypothetical protein
MSDSAKSRSSATNETLCVKARGFDNTQGVGGLEGWPRASGFEFEANLEVVRQLDRVAVR